MADALLRELQQAFPELEVRREEPLKNYTSFAIGGPAELLLLPSSAEELASLCALLRTLGVKPLLLGNGSNVLAPDEGLRGAVIVTRRASDMERRGESIVADCGASLTRIAAFAAEEGLAGLEFAYGIPGTLGRALIMNAGAYGGEMKDVTVRAEYLDGELRRRSAVGAELDFGYRRSRFGPEDVVLRAELRLLPGQREEIKARCRELTEKRRASQPLELPSAGSAFKRPASGYAAAMIDQAGLKGYTVGGAQVSGKHAGFVVNRGNATAADVKKLLEDVQRAVYDRTGILLEPEIKIL
ncbi:MAG: UDP-N-acetylmuramate dehydrogenase [Oscillospiraceae bacterium]|nr:UDP-N-acetylmuramate dehydrogenase [Oscillospiraceae bacterium]